MNPTNRSHGWRWRVAALLAVTMCSMLMVLRAPLASAVTTADIVNTAAAEIGTMEGSARANSYGAAVGLSGSTTDYSWCAAFVSWVMRETGATTYRSASVGDWVNTARAGDYGLRVVASPAPGDLVAFDWDHNGDFAYPNRHIGIVRSASSTSFTTVEGNTSNPSGGADGVFQKDRYTNSSYSTVFMRLGTTTNPPPSPINGNPAADSRGASVVAPAPGVINIFYRSTTDTLAGRSYNGTWVDMGQLGSPAGDPLTWDPDAASWASDRVDVVSRTRSGRLAHRGWGSTSGWSAWEYLTSERIASSPSITSRYSGHLDVYWKTTTGGLRHCAFSAGRWGAAAAVPNVTGVQSGPNATSMSPSHEDITYRGTNGQLWNASWDAPTGWASIQIPGKPSSFPLGSYDPGSAAPADGRLDVYMTLADGRLAKASYNRATTRWVWEDLSAVGATGLTSGVDASASSSTHEDVVGGIDGVLHRTSWESGTGWTPWRPVESP